MRYRSQNTDSNTPRRMFPSGLVLLSVLFLGCEEGTEIAFRKFVGTSTPQSTSGILRGKILGMVDFVLTNSRTQTSR